MDVPESQSGTSISQHRAVLARSIFYLHHTPLYQSPFLSQFPSIILHEWVIDRLGCLALLCICCKNGALTVLSSSHKLYLSCIYADGDISLPQIIRCRTLHAPYGSKWSPFFTTGTCRTPQTVGTVWERKGLFLRTHKVAAVDKSTCGEGGLVGGEGLHRAVGGGAARTSRWPVEDLRLAWLHVDVDTHTHTDTQYNS